MIAAPTVLAAPVTGARRAARAAFLARLTEGASPEEALEAGLDGYEAILENLGLLLPPPPGGEGPEGAARRLGAAAHDNLFNGNGWRRLLSDRAAVERAFDGGVRYAAADPEHVRLRLVRDRDRLLRFIG